MSACELRLGRYQEALADVHEVDLLCSDPPFSERTHSGHNDYIEAQAEARVRERSYDGGERRDIAYAHWTPDDVRAFVECWHARVRGWFVVMTDHTLAPHFEDALGRAGRYVFSPLQFIAPGSRVRLQGDGPSLWSTTIVVARPHGKPYSCWGTLPGGYVLPKGQGGRLAVMGGKPLWLMRSLVRDYSRPGELVCDPCAGGGTTLLAARQEGRRAIGAECDPSTYEIARRELAKPYTPLLFDAVAANDNATQGALWDAEND